ncbi:MAG: DSD1 family PLP-dependent enzyme [Desulfobacterales bacterium]|jgi:D-serine deaminase-like pyridoxal phosphate-dependent protein|nr:DSD1 family PLP-dependent enzyme [Desulfobacterales bacterium]
MRDPKKELFGKKKPELDTPCLVVDFDLLDENLQKMQARVKTAGKALRPHAKTHKCSTLAKMQVANGAIGVCAAKVSEAEALVDAGISGVLVTGPVAGREKVNRLVSLLDRAPFLMAVVDHPDTIGLLENRLAETNRQLDVLLDIDVGQRRTGVLPAKAADLAERILSSSRLRLRGIQAYAGHIQHIPRYEDRKSASRKALRNAAAVFKQLQSRAESCTIFSASGTGTARIDLTSAELTELQAGSYALMDAEYLAIESADGSDAADYHPALTMLTTVVSGPHGRQVTVDAGLKALYRDGGRPRVLTPEYGKLHYDWFGDEYGKLSAPNRTTLLPELGMVIELVVSHCDPTVNLFDRLHITQAGKVVDIWPIDLRGRCQ